MSCSRGEPFLNGPHCPNNAYLDDAACLSVGDSAIYLDGVMVLIDHHVVAERSEFGSDLGGQLGFRFASFFD